MRNLTIINNTTHVPSLSKTKIYVEDHAMPDTVINGIPCRKLGVVKNGESATFKIAEKPAIVFAVTSRGLKNYYSECYEINGEYGDVVLSGKRHFSPFKASPFVFEGGGSEEVNENRKKAFKKLMMGVLIGISALVMFSTIFSAYVVNTSINQSSNSAIEWKEDAPAKEFTIEEMSILLTENFEPVKHKNYKVVYKSEKAEVFVSEESYSQFPKFKDISLEEYLKLVMENNKLEDLKINNEDGLCYFVAETKNSNSGEADVHYLFAFKTEESVWLLQFAVGKVDHDSLKDDIFAWAKSIKFE